MMIYFVAILLILILVGMLSSNKEALIGVQNFLIISAAIFVILLLWLAFTGWNLYFHFENDDQEKTWYANIIGIVFYVFFPPILLWINKKNLLQLFKSEKRKFFKSLAILFLGVMGFFTMILVYDSIKKEAPLLGWILLISALLVSWLILVDRTIKRPSNWKSIWWGVGDPYDIALKEYNLFEKDLFKRRKVIEETWENLTQEEQDAINEKYYEELDNAEKQRFALEKKLIKEQEENYVLGLFWGIIFLLMGIFLFNVIGFVWNYVLVLIMELKFIKGNIWLARLMVVIIAIYVIGLIGYIYEIYKSKLKKTQ